MYHKVHKVHKHSTAIGAVVIFISCYMLVVSSGGFNPRSQKHADAAGCTISATLVNSCRPWIGAATGGYSMVASDAVTQFNFFNKRLNNPNVLTNPSASTTVTNHLDIIHTYHTLGSTSFTAVENNFMSQPNTYLLINYKPDFTWANATGGNSTVNSRIDAMADTFKSKPSNKFFFALYHEPEDDVSTGNCTSNASDAASGSPTDYVNMWHNVRNRFNAKGVNNVVWVMNYMGYSGWDCLTPLLWPGNSYVDWILYDPYGSGTGSGANFTTNISDFYNHMTDTSNATHDYLSKTWGLAEHGYLNKGGATQQKAIDYWTQGVSTITNNSLPRLKMFVVFDTSTNGTAQVGLDFSGNPNTAEQSAFNSFANAIFAKDVGTPPPAGDTTNPTINITSPATGTTVSGTITINVDAADNVGIAKVDIFWDGTNVIRSSTTQGTYGWGSRWNTSNAPDGTHTLKAVAYDAAGNTSNKQITITVANNTPTPQNPVISSFTASPTTVTVGSKSTLSWVTSNTVSCSVNPGGPQNSTATTWQTLSQNTAGTVTYTLTCKNSANASITASRTITVNPAPTPPTNVILTASSTSVQSGGSVTFSWSSSGSTSCTLNPGNYFANGTTSSKQITNMTSSATYKVTCINNAGSTDSNSVAVTVTATPPPPADPVIVSFVANPVAVTAGSTSTLSWSTTNVAPNGCNLAPSPLSSTGANSQWTTGALSASVSYTLTCVNSVNKAVSHSVAISVDNKPTPTPPPETVPDAPGGNGTGTVVANNGMEVTDTSENDTVQSGDLATLDGSNITDDAKVEKIEKVEYYLNEQLIQTITESPFALDTASIDPGEYNITQRTYYKDGSMSEQSQVVTVVESADTTAILGDESAGSNKLAYILPASGMTVLLGGAALYWTLVLRRKGFKLPWAGFKPGTGASGAAVSHIDPDIMPLHVPRAHSPISTRVPPPADAKPGTMIYPQENPKD